MDEDIREILTEYINIQSDFGFKYVFGNEKNKGALILFLNILFKGQLTVTDVVYHDKEILPGVKDGKRIVYDVYCTTSSERAHSPYFPAAQIKDRKGEEKTDHHFILEMQNAYVPPFEERITYYASKAIAGQGKAGWDYELEPVFVVAITDFNMSHLTPKLLHDVVLMDRDDKHPLTDKLHLLLCSLREVPRRWEECRSELEQVLYLIKNMEHMNNTSLAYREGNFKEIFDAARSSRLNKDDIIPYRQSLEYLRDQQRAIEYAKEENFEKGMAKGMAKGHEKAQLEMARKLKDMHMSDKDIMQVTGLSIEQISRL